MSDSFLPGDIRFFRQAWSNTNHLLTELNKNLAALTERVSDEVVESPPENSYVRGRKDVSTVRPGVWIPFESGSIFKVNSHLYMKTHCISGEHVD